MLACGLSNCLLSSQSAIQIPGDLLVVSPGNRVAGCLAFKKSMVYMHLSVTGAVAMRLFAGQFEYCTRWNSAFTTQSSLCLRLTMSMSNWSQGELLCVCTRDRRKV